MPFKNLLMTLLIRALDPGVHVLDGDVCYSPGQFTQWTRQIATFISCMDAAGGFDTLASGLPAQGPLVRQVHLDTLVVTSRALLDCLASL
jgi:hypothetical protein